MMASREPRAERIATNAESSGETAGGASTERISGLAQDELESVFQAAAEDFARRNPSYSQSDFSDIGKIIDDFLGTSIDPIHDAPTPLPIDIATSNRAREALFRLVAEPDANTTERTAAAPAARARVSARNTIPTEPHPVVERAEAARNATQNTVAVEPARVPHTGPQSAIAATSEREAARSRSMTPLATDASQVVMTAPVEAAAAAPKPDTKSADTEWFVDAVRKRPSSELRVLRRASRQLPDNDASVELLRMRALIHRASGILGDTVSGPVAAFINTSDGRTLGYVACTEEHAMVDFATPALGAAVTAFSKKR